jgi:hypothetical protein
LQHIVLIGGICLVWLVLFIHVSQQEKPCGQVEYEQLSDTNLHHGL